MKTIKQVERQESSEEEELSTSAQDEQESDSEDFPPGAPEVIIIPCSRNILDLEWKWAN